MRQDMLNIGAAGLSAAGIYLLAYGAGLGVPLMLLPSLPLIWLSFTRPAAWAPPAAALAIVLAAALTTMEGGLFFAGFIAIPALLFALPARAGQPAGAALAELAVYAALVFAALIAHFSQQGGLQPLIAEQLMKGGQGEPQMQATLADIANRLTFLMLAITAWWWMLLVYLHGQLTAWALRQRGGTPPSLALTPFTMPNWILALLLFTGAFSLTAQGDWALMARTVLLILLFPYFLLGASLLHAKFRGWQGGGFLLFMLYFLTLSLVWPALIIATLGIWQQCKTFIRH